MARQKKYPLTVAQKMHFYTLQYCPKPEVLNIGTSLAIQSEIDFDVLKKAIYTAYDRWESMRLRFCPGRRKNELLQYVAAKEERDIEFFEFSHWHPYDINQEMRKWSAIPFERFDSPMNRIVMISLPDDYKGIYLNVDHMTMDSSSIIGFMSDIIAIYCSCKFDTAFPPPPASYVAQLEKDLAYEAGTPAKARDEAFWEAEIKSSEPLYADFDGPAHILEERKRDPNARAVTIVTGNVDANHAVFRLEKDPSQRLMDFCRERHIPMVCLLMLALRTQMSKENGGQEDVSIVTTVARRATVAEKKCGGTRIHYFPCRTVIGRDATFLEALEIIQTAQNRIFRHANADPAKVLQDRREFYHNQPGQSYECMSLTYQPLSMTTLPGEVADIKYYSSWFPNGAAASPLYLTVMHQSLDDGMDFHFEYQTGRCTHEQLERMYYYTCKILFAGVDNPEITIGEIMDKV